MALTSFSLFICASVNVISTVFKFSSSCANMVAGHAVLLGIMGLAVGVHAYAMSTGAWGALAGASVLGMTALSVLEVFVAFLQAAVFTFLAALFIGSSMHHKSWTYKKVLCIQPGNFCYFGIGHSLYFIAHYSLINWPFYTKCCPET